MKNKKHYVEPLILYHLRWQVGGKLKHRQHKTLNYAIAQMTKFLSDDAYKNYPGVRVIFGKYNDLIPAVEALRGGRSLTPGQIAKRYLLRWIINGVWFNSAHESLNIATEKHRAIWVIHGDKEGFHLYKSICVRIN